MMSTDTLQALSNGGAALMVLFAVVSMLALFARYLAGERKQRSEEAALTRQTIKEMQAAYQDQLREIMGAVRENQHTFQDQIKSLTDDHMAVTRDVVVVVRRLDDTVRSMDHTLNELQETVRNQLPPPRPGGPKGPKP